MDTESTEETTYEPLEDRRRIDVDGSDVDATPPIDRKGALYVALVLAGIGFVLPYNSFIIASDYWQERFPGRSVTLDLSMTYIIVAFATVLLNNVLLSIFPFKVRILFGYAISVTTLLFVGICEVAWHMFSAQTAYSVNLVAVSLTAVGCTVQQSSYYGFASMFPKKYTQAVMTGESLAGLIVASTRISIKIIISSDQLSTVVFFLVSTTYILMSYLFNSTTFQSPFVRYHMQACSKIVLRPDEERVMSDLMDDSTATKYDVLSLTPPMSGSGRHQQQQPRHNIQYATSTLKSNENVTTGLSFSNPVYELSNPTAGESSLDGLSRSNESLPTTSTTPHVAFKVEHVLAPNCTGGTGRTRFANFRSGLDSRWRVVHAIYPYMVCIALAYCVTLSLYPGIEAEIRSCRLLTWMPVLLMFTFNTSDVVGKVMASFPYNWSRRQLILLSSVRIALVPLLLLCCAPRAQPIIGGEAPSFIFTIALGVTNGLAGSLPMMLAPAKVPATLKEVTGNMMTLSYNVGLTAGSLIGYVFDSMLGPPIDKPCPKFPYAPMPTFLNTTLAPKTTTTTVAATTTATTTLATTILSTVFDLTTTAASTTTSSTAGTALQRPTPLIPRVNRSLLATTATTAATLAAYGGMSAPKLLTTIQSVIAAVGGPATALTAAKSALTTIAPNSTILALH